VWGINTHYDIGGEPPYNRSRSAPNFELENGTTIGGLMHNGRGILLDFDRNMLRLKLWLMNMATQMQYVTPPAKGQLGLSALLVRPDGIIAWAADNNPDYNELQEAIGRWFVSL
jgi:hypothetical protein